MQPEPSLNVTMSMDMVRLISRALFVAEHPKHWPEWMSCLPRGIAANQLICHRPETTGPEPRTP